MCFLVVNNYADIQHIYSFMEKDRTHVYDKLNFIFRALLSLKNK